MNDPGTIVRRGLERTTPRELSLEGLYRRRDRHRRNQRITAGVVAAGIALAGLAFAIGVLDAPDTDVPAGLPSNGYLGVRRDGQLVALNLDGTGAHVLVSNPFVAEGCGETIGCHLGDGYAWSPDGDQLAFEAGVTTTDVSRWGIYVANGDGRDPRLLVECPSRPAPDGIRPSYLFERDQEGGCQAFAWSPDGTRIAFAINGSLSVVNVADRVVTPVTGCDAGCVDAYADQPAWSPDGERLAFAMATGGYAIVDLTGAREPVLAPARGMGGSGAPNTYPTWSPDGTLIVARGYDSGVVAIDPDSGEQTHLVNPVHRAWLAPPTLTPDGRTIVFAGEVTIAASEWRTASTIWTAGVDGSTARAVYDCRPCATPAVGVSPDGTWIAFSVDFGKRHDDQDGIFLVRLDGSGLRHIGLVGDLPVWQSVRQEG